MCTHYSKTHKHYLSAKLNSQVAGYEFELFQAWKKEAVEKCMPELKCQ